MLPSTAATAELVKAKLLDLSNFLIQNQNILPTATCHEIYETLSPTHKNALKQVVQTAKYKAKGVTDRKVRQQKLYEIQNVEPSKELQDRIKTWANNIESFFQNPEYANAANGYGLSASFIRIESNEETRQITTIRRRFDLRSFYIKVVALGYHTGKRWRHGGSANLTQQLKQSLANDGLEVDEIQMKLERYIEIGSSWDLWATRLGGPGYLLILPQMVAEGLYERRQNRADIDTLVGEVCRLGIRDIADRLNVLPLGRDISERLESISPEETFSYDLPSKNQNRPPNRPIRASKDNSPSLCKTMAQGPPVPASFPQTPAVGTEPLAYDAPSALVPELRLPQWGSTNTMAFSTEGIAFPGNGPLMGFEISDLEMPLWGSPQALSYDINPT